jgi:putative DNA primase/helicase
VLIVEGEKAAEDGALYLPPGWCMTTWAGGTNAIHKADWSILQGRRCVIWPDNDEAGLTAAGKIGSIIGPSAAIITPSSEYPSGWDLADPLPNGITKAMIAQTIESAYVDTAPPVESVLPDAPAPIDDDGDGFIDEHVLWRALGYDDSYYYVMPASTGIILRLGARELMSAAGCLRIINDITYWQGAFNGGKVGTDWTAAGSSVMRACEVVGYYDEGRIRGRGVWIDEGRVVVNTGDQLIVDGRAVNPVKVKSKKIYKTSESLFIDDFDADAEATHAEGRAIVELCNAPRWDKPMHGDLLAGWIATSLVCGALHWRTHIWVTGNAGSGKSTVINTIAAACVGDVAAYPLGETTEAGIRQHIGSDARPVIFDEMEGTDERGPAGANRRNAIISLMRMASSEGRGRIMKGSASHQAVSFTMRSSFLVASIGMSLKEAPDLTRTMVLGLKPLMNDARPEERRRAQQQWEVMNRLASRVRTDMPERLFCRMTEVLPVLMKNAQVFREAIAEKMGNRRLGDQVGTLLAGRFALTTRKIFTVEECMEYLNRFDWVGVVATPGEREDIRLVNHIRQHVIKVQARHGNTVERTIGELIHVSKGTAVDDEVDSIKATGALSRMGIKADDAADVIWLSKQSQAIDAIMSKSTNPTDWASVVSRYPKAVKASYRIRFAAGSAAAIGLPYSAWVD